MEVSSIPLLCRLLLDQGFTEYDRQVDQEDDRCPTPTIFDKEHVQNISLVGEIAGPVATDESKD